MTLDECIERAIRRACKVAGVRRNSAEYIIGYVQSSIRTEYVPPTASDRGVNGIPQGAQRPLDVENERELARREKLGDR